MKHAVLMAAALTIAACSTGSRTPVESELYLVRARGAEVISATTDRPILRVAPIDVAAHIRGVAIVTDDGRVRTMVNQRFAAPLNALVEQAVTDRLRAAGRYGVVLPPGSSGAAPPFVLRLSLRSFEIAVDGGGYLARVVFDGLVERDVDRRIVRSFRASADRPANGPEGGGFIRGLEDALNAAIDALIIELDAAGVGDINPLMKPDADADRQRTGD